MGTMKALGGASGGTVVQAGDRAINFLSPHQLDALILAIRENKVEVSPADAVVEVDVHVPEASAPVVEVSNNVDPADVVVNNAVTFSLAAKHLYLGLLLHAAILVLLGALAYVAIPQLDQYLNAGNGLSTESVRGFFRF